MPAVWEKSGGAERRTHASGCENRLEASLRASTRLCNSPGELPVEFRYCFRYKHKGGLWLARRLSMR